MLTAIAGTMPSRSVILPMMTPPTPKPRKIMVAASETAPRLAANSCCTTGITTTTDHIPTAPTEPISTASASRSQAWRESGVNGGESLAGWEGACTAATSSPRGVRVKPHGAILGMQMQCNRTNVVIPGQSAGLNPESQLRRSVPTPSRFRVRLLRIAPE